MTIPFVVMVGSGTAWLVLSLMPARESISDLLAWLHDLCRIVFAASVLIVLYGMVNQRF